MVGVSSTNKVTEQPMEWLANGVVRAVHRKLSRRMGIKELLDRANKGYPDGFLSNYYDAKGNLRDATGDTLAEFIVVELIETFDPDLTEEKQLGEAIRAMERAREDVEGVIRALRGGGAKRCR